MHFSTNFRFGIILMLAGFILACSGKTDAELITERFLKYQKAIINNQGFLAAENLDQKTLEWYDTLLKMAKESKKSELEKSNFLSKLIVLSIRQEFSKREIADLNAKSVFAFGLEKSLYDQDSIKQLTIGSLKIDATRAVAAMKMNNKPTGSYIKFIREGGDWMINFASMINVINEQATGRLVENIPNENKKAIAAVRNISEKPIKRNIWTPSNNWRR